MLSHLPVPVVTIGLLLCSNLFMTFAWYGHLRFPKVTLWHIVIISWLIAFFEQEIISLTIFMGFSVLYLGEPLKWNYILGFAMIVAAAFIIFHEW